MHRLPFIAIQTQTNNGRSMVVWDENGRCSLYGPAVSWVESLMNTGLGQEHARAFPLLFHRIYFASEARSAGWPSSPSRHRKKNTWIWHLLKIQPSGYLARFARPKPASDTQCPGETQRDRIAAKNIRRAKNGPRKKASARIFFSPPKGNFPSSLEKLFWRLDRSIDN